VNVFNPALIVVGGAIAAAQGDRLLGPARERVSTEAFSTPARRVRIVPAELGGDVSLAGAMPLVTARLGDPAWRRTNPSAPAAASAQPGRQPQPGGIAS
jgi:predicted NBD/HSP70 family sugar kinase